MGKMEKKLLYALTPGEHLRRIFRITKFKAPEMAADLPLYIYIERERDWRGGVECTREKEKIKIK